MCDYKKGSRIKTGVFFCDRVLVFASHIRYNDRKLFQRERRKTVMKKIVFATGNAGKMKEICEILADLPVEIYSMKEAGISVEIDENGKTFEENAKIKAQTVAGCTDGDTIVLADDSGLEVDALNGEPGVYSARYMGEDTSYRIKNQSLVERLEGVPVEKRTARFVCVIAAAFPDGTVCTTKGTIEGKIGYEERGENGFDRRTFSGREKRSQPQRKSTGGDERTDCIIFEIRRGKRMSMKFLIVSDTHGRMYNLEEAMEREEFDGMIHCGDVEGMDDLIKSKVNGPCYMVMGNNDWFSNLPAEIQVNIDDYRAFITHGHNYGVSLGLEGIYAEALSRGVDIVLFGHTHRPVAEKRGNLWIVNPGSLTYPRQMGRKPSYAMLTINEEHELSVEIKYLD